MANLDKRYFKRKIGSERAVLMLPLNVVMVGRIRGTINHSKIEATLNKLRSRHPLLAVRVQIDNDGTGSYTNKDVPAIQIQVERRQNEEQWITHVKQELRTSFPMETGPLFRCVLVQSEEVSEIILCGHHVICDGKSLTYLIRDILEQLASPSNEIESLPLPPAIDCDTASTPPSISLIVKTVIGLMNRAWRKKNLRFDFNSMDQLHQCYWQKNDSARLLAWELPESETSRFVARCRNEAVTVNSALWAAFLIAQDEMQGSSECFRNRAGLAISTRDKLKIPVGESFGFYASSHKVLLKRYQGKSFWDTARTVHEQLKRSIESANPFQMLSATLLDPTILDSLYFSKYGLARNGMSDRLLKKMMWNRINFGFAITNVGRVDIPTSYGDLKLETVYGPLVYSDVNEKTVGVITVGNRVTFIMSYNMKVVDTHTATQLRDKVLERIREALESSCE